MERRERKSGKENIFSDLDLLLFIFGFTSYTVIRFIIESGWILGSALFATAIILLKRTASIRQTAYLYSILLFTTQEEQKWLMMKFSLNSKIYPKENQNKYLTSEQINDVFNKTIGSTWSFTKGFLEKKILNKLEAVIFHLNDKKLSPFLQYLIDLRPKEVNLGSKPPVIRSIEVISSSKADILVANVLLEYISDGSFKFLTRVKQLSIDSLKIKGEIRIEVGPLTSFPPFIEGFKVFMAEDPNIHFSISNIPHKLQNLAKVAALEKISSVFVTPNLIRLHLSTRDISTYLPSGMLFVHVVEARSLPKEVFGQSDPFCVIQLGSKKVFTETIKNDVNPVWKFKTQMFCHCDPRHGDVDISFSIYDRDMFLDDFLFKTKLNVRRVLEEKSVDEWLYSKDEEPKSEKSEKSKMRLRVQIAWQDFLPQSRNEENTEPKIRKSEEGNSHLGQEVNRKSIRDSPNSSQLRGIPESESQRLVVSFPAVVFVWIETAERLNPYWDDFRVELDFYGTEKKTPFVPKDPRGRWAFRKGFSFPCMGSPQETITIEIISRSHEKSAGHFSLKVWRIREDFCADLQFKNFFLKNKKEENLESFIKLTCALKRIEPLPEEFLKSVRSAENEAERFSDSCSVDTATVKLETPTTKYKSKERERSSPKPRSIFSFNKIEWDSCSPFLHSGPLRNEDVYRKSILSSDALSGSGDHKEVSKEGGVNLSDGGLSQDDKTSTSKENKQISRWSKFRHSSKFNKHKNN